MISLKNSAIANSAIALGLAIVAAGLMALTTAYLGQVISNRYQHERLALAADVAAQNTLGVYQRAADVLRSIAKTDYVPCSPQHISRMRDLTSTNIEITAIGYFDHNGTTCSSWGASVRTEQPQPDYTNADGIGITPNYDPVNSRSEPKLRLSLGDYGLTVNSQHFINVMLPDATGLAIFASDGALLASVGETDATTADSKLDVAKVSLNGWSAVTTAPKVSMFGFFRDNRSLLLAASGLVGLLVFALVLWLMQRRRSPRSELAIAVRKREFIVHYQPIMNLKTGRCHGAEALIRWQRPDGQMVRPDLFIPLAEESGLILPITDQLIERVMEDMQHLLITEPSMHIAINLSASDITTGRVFPLLKDQIDRRGIRPNQIWIEATERSFVDVELARSSVVKARHLGHAVAIDDFGTGYSSLQYLQNLPIDALKIDKSFIDTIGQNSASSTVTPYIIDMAKALKLLIVAEGVETRNQADYLVGMNVDFGQGWLFSKALPGAAFIAFYHQANNAEGTLMPA